MAPIGQTKPTPTSKDKPPITTPTQTDPSQHHVWTKEQGWVWTTVPSGITPAGTSATGQQVYKIGGTPPPKMTNVVYYDTVSKQWTYTPAEGLTAGPMRGEYYEVKTKEGPPLKYVIPKGVEGKTFVERYGLAKAFAGLSPAAREAFEKKAAEEEKAARKIETITILATPPPKTLWELEKSKLEEKKMLYGALAEKEFQKATKYFGKTTKPIKTKEEALGFLGAAPKAAYHYGKAVAYGIPYIPFTTGWGAYKLGEWGTKLAIKTPSFLKEEHKTGFPTTKATVAAAAATAATFVISEIETKGTKTKEFAKGMGKETARIIREEPGQIPVEIAKWVAVTKGVEIGGKIIGPVLAKTIFKGLSTSEQIARLKEIERKLGAKKYAKWKKEFNAAEKLGVEAEVGKFSLKEVETLRGLKEQVKARPILEKVILDWRRKLVVSGTTASRGQILGKDILKKLGPPHDVDLFIKRLSKLPEFKKYTLSKLKEGRIKDAYFVRDVLNIGPKRMRAELRKVMDIHGWSMAKEFPWSTRPVKTLEGIRVIRLTEQYRRKLMGALEPGRVAAKKVPEAKQAKLILKSLKRTKSIEMGKAPPLFPFMTSMDVRAVNAQRNFLSRLTKRIEEKPTKFKILKGEIGKIIKPERIRGLGKLEKPPEEIKSIIQKSSRITTPKRIAPIRRMELPTRRVEISPLYKQYKLGGRYPGIGYPGYTKYIKYPKQVYIKYPKTTHPKTPYVGYTITKYPKPLYPTYPKLKYLGTKYPPTRYPLIKYPPYITTPPPPPPPPTKIRKIIEETMKPIKKIKITKLFKEKRKPVYKPTLWGEALYRGKKIKIAKPKTTEEIISGAEIRAPSQAWLRKLKGGF